MAGNDLDKHRCSSTEPTGSSAPSVDRWAAKLWLWRNGDHYLAFIDDHPTYDGGDPKTLGEPIGYALLDWDAYETLLATASSPTERVELGDMSNTEMPFDPNSSEGSRSTEEETC